MSIFPYIALFLVIALSVQAVPPIGSANTLPNIMARLTSQGEDVSIAAQATDSAGMTWTVLSRNQKGGITYSLVRSIGGGADGVADGPALPMMLGGIVHDQAIEPLLTAYVQHLLVKNKDHAGAQKFIKEKPVNFSNASGVTRKIFSRYGLQLP